MGDICVEPKLMLMFEQIATIHKKGKMHLIKNTHTLGSI